MPKYRFDFDEMLETAKVLLVLNPSVEGMTPMELVSHMESRAYQNLTKPQGYLSTYGYVLTAFPYPGTDEIGIKASISAYTVRQYLTHRAAKEIEMAFGDIH